jgi:hypothetical protein
VAPKIDSAEKSDRLARMTIAMLADASALVWLASIPGTHYFVNSSRELMRNEKTNAITFHRDESKIMITRFLSGTNLSPYAHTCDVSSRLPNSELNSCFLLGK